MTATSLTTFPARAPIALARFASTALVSMILASGMCVVAAMVGVGFLGSSHGTS